MDHYMTLGKGHSWLTHDVGWDTSTRGAEQIYMLEPGEIYMIDTVGCYTG